MSEASDQRSREFLKVSSQFKLGALVTESSHPITANLSDVARQDIARALEMRTQSGSGWLNLAEPRLLVTTTNETCSETLKAICSQRRVDASN